MKKQKFYEILYVVCFIIFSISILYIVTYLFFTYKDETDIEEIQSIMSDISKVESQNNIEIINYTNMNSSNNIENAIVSEETLNEDKIAAFISGYQEVSPMDRTQINTALKITWCIESPWWINKEGSLLEDEKASLFKQQLLWLTEHFFEL